jgi:hypothetical protein
MPPAATVARYVLLEARRSGLPWLALAGIAGAVVLAVFLAQVALTEGRELQAAVAGALLRAFAAFLVAAHVVASVGRESNDKGIELALALPVSRSAWYLGKLAGFAACGALLAGAFALPLALWSAPAALAQWWLSLAAELALVAAMGLFFALALPQGASALAATVGLYVLGRAVSAIQAIAAGPLAEEGASGRAARGLIDALALVLPRLDQVTRTEWLLYGAGAATDLLAALAGMAIYFAFLAAAGLFDFHRRNL